jgi:Zn-dependent protease
MSRNGSYAVAVVFVLLFYAAVLVHEVAHVVVARLLGMQVTRIVLQPLGGASEVVEEQPGSPDRDYLVAAVGPLTSCLLAGVGLAVAPGFPPHSIGRELAAGFGFLNIAVVVFNLLPGLPLDGGRMLRSVVWRIGHDKNRATIAAGWAGRGLAVLTAVYAIASQNRAGSGLLTRHNAAGYGGLYLLVVALFMWSSASYTIVQARVSAALPRIDLRRLMRPALRVAADLPVAEAVRRAREADARALVVVDAYGHPSGLVSEAAVAATPSQRQPWIPVSDLARPVEEGLVLNTAMTGDRLLAAVQQTPATEYLVLEPSGILGGVLARGDLVAALQAAGLR